LFFKAILALVLRFKFDTTLEPYNVMTGVFGKKKPAQYKLQQEPIRFSFI
tara:strand:- start:940 stop:1089 length:150 start_codon:yes stop_codon:yes gene_type:complete